MQGRPTTIPNRRTSGLFSYGVGLRALLTPCAPRALPTCTQVGRGLGEVAGHSCQPTLQGGPFISPLGGGLGEWRGLSSILWMAPWGAGINTPSLEPRFCRKRWRRTPEVFPNYRWGIISLGGVLISSLRRIIKAESLLPQGRPLCMLSPRQLGCPGTMDVLGSDGNALLTEWFPALNAPRLLCGFVGANVSHLWTVKTPRCVLCQGDRLVGPRWSWAF